MAQPARPRYDPITWNAADPNAAASLQNQESTDTNIWHPLIHCHAHFPVELVRFGPHGHVNIQLTSAPSSLS